LPCFTSDNNMLPIFISLKADLISDNLADEKRQHATVR